MLRLGLTIIVLLVSTGLVHAEKRVALVIGNSNYKLISPLANPKNDAELMSATLSDVGFDVVSAIDVDYQGMRRAVRKFGRTLRRAGKDAVGLLYFAGHGVQARGTNYLIPLGANIEDAADLELEALSASNILSQMESAGNRLNLVVLDACRNNPFKGGLRGAGRGLARINAASGSLVAFAAAPGQVASDRKGANSPYTTELVKAMRQPGLAVEQVFKQVRVGVEGQTGGAQTPWEESSLRGDFYFVPKESTPVAAQESPKQSDREALFWNSVKDSASPALLQAYIDRYPEGTFTSLASILIEQLKQKEEQESQKQNAEQLALAEMRKKEIETQRQREVDLLKKLERARQAQEEAERLRAEAESRGKEEKRELAALTPEQISAETAIAPKDAAEMAALAIRYETGTDIVQSIARAAHWYRQAADKGHADAKYRLGLLYYQGRGVALSRTEAAIHILEAIKLDHQPSLNALLEGTTLRNREFVIAVQQRLKALSMYSGKIDGKWGAGSKEATLIYAGRRQGPVVKKPSKNQNKRIRSKPTVVKRKKPADVDKSKRTNRPRGCVGGFSYSGDAQECS